MHPLGLLKTKGYREMLVTMTLWLATWDLKHLQPQGRCKTVSPVKYGLHQFIILAAAKRTTL